MDYYSVSRLKAYRTCSKYYEYQYVIKQNTYDVSKSTFLGSLVHQCLEYYYKDKDRKAPITYFRDAIINTINNSFGIDVLLIETIVEKFINYSQGINELYHKASDKYKGKDAIRTKSGSVSSCPEMTNDWKRLKYQLGVKHDQTLINDFIISLVDIDFNIADIIAEAYNLILNYSRPPELEKVISVELAISEPNNNDKNNPILNPVLMPDEYGGKEGIYLRGYIDLIADIGGDTIIVDHKTGRSKFSASDVYHNVQLLAYAYAYKQINGNYPTYIGINNISTGLVFTPTPDEDHLKEVINTLFSSHHGISYGIYNKYTPEPYSPCKNMYGKACPFLNHCWPNVDDE